MDAAEQQRLRAIGVKYVSNLLIAADSNVKLHESKLAKRQYLALLELQHLLTPSQSTLVNNQLRLPEILSAGLLRKVRTVEDYGRTRWIFDDEPSSDEPVEGVQMDNRSVCPLVRTPRELLDAALDIANVGTSDIVADLGCGDGRLLLRAARRGAKKAIGFDVNPWCLQRSRDAAERAGCSDLVEVINYDMFALEEHPKFQCATVVYVYLIPRVIAKLKPLLLSSVARGQRVVIYCTTGQSSERPGNELGDLKPAAQAMGGLLRLYSRETES